MATHGPVVPVVRPTRTRADFAVYIVQPGDSLLDIAERHGTDVEALIALNRLRNPDVIVVGTSLKVPALTALHPLESPEQDP